MALITATINLNFQANYAGGHRICWRIQGSGDPYDCSTIVTCSVGACNETITIQVNNTSCDGPITFEGYIQALCEEEASELGRIPWEVTYTPTVVCQRTEFTCAKVGATLNITNAGTNYEVGDAITLTRDIGDSEILDFAATVATVDTGGEILTLDITENGLYDTPPTGVNITTTSGINAVLEIELLDCPSSIAGVACVDNDDNGTNDNITLENLSLNDVLAVCLIQIADYGPQYIHVESGCCMSNDTSDNEVCQTIEIEYTPTEGPNFIDLDILSLCNGEFEEDVRITEGVPQTFCIIQGGFVDPQIAGLTFTITGNCS